jgi:hypothetical protein
MEVYPQCPAVPAKQMRTKAKCAQPRPGQSATLRGGTGKGDDAANAKNDATASQKTACGELGKCP